MKILVLNGSPNPNGNTDKMCRAFLDGVSGKNHEVSYVHLGAMNIGGCKACYSCQKGEKKCLIDDEMQKLYPFLKECEMLVLGSPIYYLGYSGQAASMYTRLMALGKLENCKKTALLLAAGNSGTFDGPIAQYQGCFPRYMQTEDMGVFTVSYQEHNLEAVQADIKEMASKL